MFFPFTIKSQDSKHLHVIFLFVVLCCLLFSRVVNKSCPHVKGLITDYCYRKGERGIYNNLIFLGTSEFFLIALTVGEFFLSEIKARHLEQLVILGQVKWSVFSIERAMCGFFLFWNKSAALRTTKFSWEQVNCGE